MEPEADLGAVKTLQYVPGVNTSGNVYLQDSSFDPLREDQVWVGTESKKIMIYSAQDPERGRYVMERMQCSWHASLGLIRRILREEVPSRFRP